MMPSPIILAAIFLTGNSLPKLFMGGFSSNSCLDVCEVKKKSVRVLLRYFGMKLFSLEVSN